MATHDLMTRWGLVRLAAAVMLALGLVAGPFPPASATPGPKVTAHSAILVDIADGSVLWQRNPTVRRAPASLTKMLTALTVKASLPMTRRLIVSPSADRTEANRLGLGAGHDISVAQALTALLMISANDMGVVLALHAAGSISHFSLAMDLEGRHLGLTGSTWRNPHGLDAKGHLSTAFDLAILARAILRDPWLAEVASRRGTVSFVTPDGRRRALYNKGHFLHGYRGAIGVKTGFTDDAGRCVAAAARRGNRTLVAVVLRSADPAKDAAALMDWGFGPGRTVRTSTRLPPYVAPVSVKALLEPGAADPVASQGPTPATTPAPTPAAPVQAPAGTGAAGALSAAAVVLGIILLGALTVRAGRRAIRTFGTGPEPDEQVPPEPPRPPGHDLLPPGGPARRRRRLRL
jgi:D-alanyl-D-alanine carboxypeptidase